MSLINDALKKAQKQRTGEAPSLHSMPSVGGESPQRIARRAKPAGFNTLILRAGIAGGVALILAVGAYFALRGKPETGNRKPESKASVANNGPQGRGPSTELAPKQPTTNSEQPASAAPAFTLKTEPVAKAESVRPKPETGNLKPENQEVATEVAKSEQPKAGSTQVSGFRSQVSAAAPVAPPEPPKPALKLEPRAIQYIENLKIAGVRVSTTDAKVLMNDRVYRIGSTVEAEMGLKLVEIASGALTFEDERGGRYTRNF